MENIDKFIIYIKVYRMINYFCLFIFWGIVGGGEWFWDVGFLVVKLGWVDRFSYILEYRFIVWVVL